MISGCRDCNRRRLLTRLRVKLIISLVSRLRMPLGLVPYDYLSRLTLCMGSTENSLFTRRTSTFLHTGCYETGLVGTTRICIWGMLDVGSLTETLAASNESMVDIQPLYLIFVTASTGEGGCSSVSGEFYCAPSFASSGTTHVKRVPVAKQSLPTQPTSSSPLVLSPNFFFFFKYYVLLRAWHASRNSGRIQGGRTVNCLSPRIMYMRKKVPRL